MKKKQIFFLIFSIITLTPFILYAAGADPGIRAGTGRGDFTGDVPIIENPLGTSDDAKDPRYLIGRIISTVLGIIGSIALALFIYGGLLWMTSAGNEEKVRKGKDVIIWATLGLALIFSSYAIVRFVLGAFLSP